MSEDSKRRQQKHTKHEAKEQRKHKAKNPGRSKPDTIDASKTAEPVQSTPSEQFKHLKRETEENIIISNEANSKYNKKEIQSNWHKYEIEDESPETEEQQSLGADYEQLSQKPLSVGNHFQFKHEKSWDTAVTSTEFDKYFNIDLSDLALALNSVPFYIRNSIDKNIFSTDDNKNMDYSSNKYKQKYNITKSVINNVKTRSTKASENNTPAMSSEASDSMILIDEPRKEQVLAEAAVDQPAGDDNLEDLLSRASLRNTRLDVSKQEQVIPGDSPLVVADAVSHAAAPFEEVIKKPNCQSAANAPQDLEKWLDDFLDS